MDTNFTRLRPLFVAQILYENTDENHTMTIAEILQHLHDERKIDAFRKTIKEDIDLLIKAGFDIEFIKSSQNKYHVLGRDFDVAELKVLIDAVESARFISKDKSGRLVEKISKLGGPYVADQLKRNIDVEHRIKQDNEQVFYIVDVINEAINAGKQIGFQYFQYNVKKERKPRYDGYWYKLSPYRLVWNGDYYYVVGYYEKYQQVVSFRIDRMIGHPDILDEDIIPMPKDFDLDQHLNTMFHMFNAERRKVELICDNDVMDAIIDKFGEDVETYAYDMNAFKAVVEIATSKVFYMWIFGFEGKVRIQGPEDVKEEYRLILERAFRNI